MSSTWLINCTVMDYSPTLRGSSDNERVEGTGIMLIYKVKIFPISVDSL